jgi:hypothetical protein
VGIFDRINRSAREDQPDLRCSFCNKAQHDVRKLIAGPTVFICDECVQVCNDIIADDDRFEAYRASRPSPPPPASPRSDPQEPRLASAISCALCRLPLVLEDALPLEERGFLCLGCAEVIEAALAERRSSEP